MKLATATSFFCLLAFSMVGQENSKERPLEEVFKIKVDTIERRAEAFSSNMDYSYYLILKVTNISSDTVDYTSNSCFYYNHYIMKANGMEFHVNEDGGCLLNSEEAFTIAPGETIRRREYAKAKEFDSIPLGAIPVLLSVPLVQRSTSNFFVDGRFFRTDGRLSVKQAQYLKVESLAVMAFITPLSRRDRKKMKRTALRNNRTPIKPFR